ncbi:MULTISPECIES: DUF411 domain-containing protein [unclassified Paracoccus (in: a-proteobacteria)]|uniref:DUF411 domain-containing protein n=1 Tax=Paracoccus TaxID=265 RepID=UPI000CD1BF63|nr:MULTISPECIES: DUF411 domain-containing protein [unclassified Paracoccus (in: a-proteobacteria)]MDQ1901969.1 DUF411 domain-containing protein [Paracoccus sp. WLY502]
MTLENLSRRTILTSGAGLLALSALPARARGIDNQMLVVKDPNCGCCAAWIEIVEAAGFAVTIELSAGTALMRYKSDNGIPEAMASCHTARIGGYMLEGHVPVADIRRLLEDRPDAIGLAVPGMPYGSPGMGPESEREAYDVVLIRKNGTSEVFTHYPAA